MKFSPGQNYVWVFRKQVTRNAYENADRRDLHGRGELLVPVPAVCGMRGKLTGSGRRLQLRKFYAQIMTLAAVNYRHPSDYKTGTMHRRMFQDGH